LKNWIPPKYSTNIPSAPGDQGTIFQSKHWISSDALIVRRYMANALRDYFKLGISFAELIANADGSQIVGISTINAQHCRLTQAQGGSIKNCIIHGNWLDPPAEAFKTLPILDNYDPEADLISRRIAGKNRQ